MGGFNKSGNGDCPCHRNCEDRTPGCHDHCDAYRQWRKKVDEKRKAERQYYRNMDTMSDAKKREMWKKKRYRNHSWQSKPSDV